MPTIHIAALGMTRKLLGFSRRSVELETTTVAELLRDLETVDGSNLYDHLVSDGQLRGDYAIVVDGLRVRADQLDRPLKGGEQVMTMAILRHLHGG
ncbi:MAG: MoaD/ThiS family protein [Acidobacteriota bacterium]